MAATQLTQIGETLKQNVKTLVDGVRKAQPSNDTTYYANLGRDLYATLKIYVPLLSPNAVFINKLIEEEAKVLKESVRQLLQKGKVAFVEGNSNPENNKQMEQCARDMILCITKITKAQSSDGTTQRPGSIALSQRAPLSPRATTGGGSNLKQSSPAQPIATANNTNNPSSLGERGRSTSNRHKYSVRIGGKAAKELSSQIAQAQSVANVQAQPSIPSLNLSQNSSGPPSTRDTEERKKAYKSMMRKSRASISLAKASVQAMLAQAQEQEQGSNSGDEATRNRSKTMQQNKLLQQALAQIAAMEGKMNEMERKMEDEYKKPGSTGPSITENEMMSMMTQIQQRLKDTEEEMNREKRLIELEKSLKQKEQDMLAKEEAMAQRLEKMLSRLDMDKFKEMEAKLEKLDKIDQLIAAGGGGLMPGRGYDFLKKEVERLQAIIFDDKTPEKEQAAANIELEKAMKELERCPEFMEEQRKLKEEWTKKNEPLNKAAYEKVSSRLKEEARADPQAFRDKLSKSGELALILLTKEAILKKHESDFKVYVLALDEDELRALFYNMPKFRSDQRTQIAFVESLENKIREREKSPPPPPVIPAANRVKKQWKPKKATGGGGGASFLDELKKRSMKQ
eukprot:TRINITY_DN2527_c0_g2_i1.p1 TRINITY_DN2527_c0_g2~~TRINITY_DN2527_c0_g2_i1.p1  ORF type:complete len:625 (+),score=140.03 TRINITY_DN2527_c0_g2_i1:121-1995(+)